jgi:hypothetical protein
MVVWGYTQDDIGPYRHEISCSITLAGGLIYDLCICSLTEEKAVNSKIACLTVIMPDSTPAGLTVRSEERDHATVAYGSERSTSPSSNSHSDEDLFGSEHGAQHYLSQRRDADPICVVGMCMLLSTNPEDLFSTKLTRLSSLPPTGQRTFADRPLEISHRTKKWTMSRTIGSF